MSWISQIVERIVLSADSGQAEEPIFSSAFSVVRQQAKDFKDKLEDAARVDLQKRLINDLKERGYVVVSVNVVLGKYRGSRFVTSAKVTLESDNERKARSAVSLLRAYHPRYDLKSYNPQTKVGEYNIR